MKYCTHCGNPINEEAVLCVKCGQALFSSASIAPYRPKKITAKAITLICIGVVVLALVLFVTSILIRSDVKLDDLTVKPSKLSALMKYGIPTSVNEDFWIYEDCLTLHGIELEELYIDFELNSYWVRPTDTDDYEPISTLLHDKCVSKNHTYYYKNLKIELAASLTLLYIEIVD